ncbi:MAG TPA: ribonuclease III [Rhodobacteraceae bacterium]|nr:ribonuclease III [Paracoccaceae bacterium]
MSANSALQRFSERLGYRFKDEGLLMQALTHASAARNKEHDNQRLEFLGDRVLGLAISQALFEADRGAREGQLAPRFNALVRKEACAEVAEQINLGEALMLGRSEMRSGGRRKVALLGDAMEAVIAAVYLDAGFSTTQALILRLWGSRIFTAQDRASDPKSSLQEWAQARGFSTPVYTDISRSGPDHQPVFIVEAALENGHAARGEAASKKNAQVQAATALLSIIKDEK